MQVCVCVYVYIYIYKHAFMVSTVGFVGARGRIAMTTGGLLSQILLNLVVVQDSVDDAIIAWCKLKRSSLKRRASDRRVVACANRSFLLG